MGLFGSSKADQTQDQQLQDLWKWIDALNKRVQTLEKNQNILNNNNNYFIQRDKETVAYIQASKEKDAEHDTLIQSIKNMAKAVTTEEPTT